MYFEQTEKFKEMVKAHTRIERDVIITDLRGLTLFIRGTDFLFTAFIRAEYICLDCYRKRQGLQCGWGILF